MITQHDKGDEDPRLGKWFHLGDWGPDASPKSAATVRKAISAESVDEPVQVLLDFFEQDIPRPQIQVPTAEPFAGYTGNECRLATAAPRN